MAPSERTTVMAAGKYKEGQRVRVRFTGTVVGPEADEADDTTLVYDGEWYHALYLGDPDVFPGFEPEEEAEVTVDFTGTVTSETGDRATTGVLSGSGCIHYVYLGSPSVSPAGEEKEEAGALPKAGDRVAVAFTGTRAEDGRLYSGATSAVLEDNGRVHYLFLEEAAAREALTGSPGPVPPGGRLTVAFRALAGNSTYEDATLVTTFTRNGNQSFIHYIDLSSPSVTAFREEPPAAPVKEEPPEAARVIITQEDIEAGLRLTSRDTIGWRAASDRIAELTGRTAGYQVIRGRDREVVHRAATIRDCRQWLDDNDYIPDRFGVLPCTARAGDTRELNELTALRDAAITAAGGGTWIAHAAGYFSEDWARAEARTDYGSADGELPWPLPYVNWTAAALAARDESFTGVDALGTTWYVTGT